ncbi:MAG TPA: hypothetical protein VLH15_07660 [Dehalococcoidales bacterium]|nr:hypothetical protein [Dehalococcoidales bacterium]
MPQTDYTRFLVDKPWRKTDGPAVLNMTSPAMQLMSSAQVKEAAYNIRFAWVTGIPEPNPPTPLHTHDYNEVLLFIGGDCRDPENLWAEVDLTVGSQKLSVNSTGSVFIPAGVPHGRSTWKKVMKPHVIIAVGIGKGEYQAGPASQSGKASIEDYSRFHVRKPAYEVLAGTPVKGRQGPSSMTFVNNSLIPGSNIYIEGGWVWDMPEPNPHIFEHGHDFEEIVIHFGADYTHPYNLGAEIEFGVGGQSLSVSQTSAVFVPAGVKHGPLTWKKYLYPHLEMAIMPGAGTLAEADPGGHIKKTKRRKNNG